LSIVLGTITFLLTTVVLSGAQETSSYSGRQSLNDAWWTGPLLANSAATLPKGHLLIEPYLYDVISNNQNGWGSRAYVLYALVNRFTAGFIPIFGYNQVSNGLSSSRLGIGDFTLLAQFRLTQYQSGDLDTNDRGPGPRILADSKIRSFGCSPQ
jgi:hypothetical protein